MDAGQLDDRITLKAVYSSSIDAAGGVHDFYATSSVWCKAKSESGDETTVGNIDRNTVRYSFFTRYNPSITEDCEIIFHNQPYNVKYIESPFSRNQWMYIHAYRYVGEGK